MDTTTDRRHAATATVEGRAASPMPPGTESAERLPALRAIGVLALATALTVALHALGAEPAFRIDWADPLGWLRVTRPAEAVLAVARASALVAVYRALVPAIVYALLLLVRARDAAAAVRSAVPRRLRPAIERLAALSGAAAIAVSAVPAVAMPAFPPLPAAPSQDEGPVVPSPTRYETTAPPPGVPATALSARPVPPPVVAPPRRRQVEPAAQSAGVGRVARPGEHVVRPGEHLWSIAAQEVARRTGQAVDDLDPGDIATYWRRVVAENRERLRSDDPDLVHPGERVVLPADPA